MTREEAINRLKTDVYKYADFSENPNESEFWDAFDMAIKALETEPCGDTGEISDGYHTFNQLYHQRAILFATIVNQNADIAWKSYKHSDGKYCFDNNGEWFIVGVDTPEGSYTYHYSKEYWDYFKCKELECGKEWDGHTEEDVTRLLSLSQKPCEDCISRQEAIDTLDYGAELIKHALDELSIVGSEREKFTWGLGLLESYIDDLKVLPSVTPKTKQEPSGDCISRAELKKRLQEHHDFFVNAYGGFRNLPRNDKARVDEITHCIAEVVNMPSVRSKVEQEPKARWIPVSERLPDDRREVLVTAYWHETYQVMMASYYGDGLWWCVPFNNCGKHMQKLHPKAWRPLPKPYKEGLYDKRTSNSNPKS